MIIPYRFFVTTYRLHHATLRKFPEEHRSRLLFPCLSAASTVVFSVKFFACSPSSLFCLQRVLHLVALIKRCSCTNFLPYWNVSGRIRSQRGLWSNAVTMCCLLHPFRTRGRDPDGSFLFPGYLISLFTLIRRITETSSCLLFFGFVDSISFLTQFASSQNHLLKEKWGAGNPQETRFLTFRRVILSAYCRNTCCEIVRLECSSSVFAFLTLLCFVWRLFMTSSNLSLGKCELER